MEGVRIFSCKRADGAAKVREVRSNRLSIVDVSLDQSKLSGSTCICVKTERGNEREREGGRGVCGTVAVLWWLLAEGEVIGDPQTRMFTLVNSAR